MWLPPLQYPFHQTAPLWIGNLFASAWNKREEKKKNCTLRIRLLEYYMSCGWTGHDRMRAVLLAAAARGDVEGMRYLVVEHRLVLLNDAEYCTVAAAAGRQEALSWLLEQACPWDPTEVYREASENGHQDVLEFVAGQCQNTATLLRTNYGMGLPP